MENQIQELNQPKQPNPKTNWLWIIIIAAIAVAVAIVGTYLYQASKKDQKKPVSVNANSTENTLNKETVISTNQTVNQTVDQSRKTYTNSKYGYSFNYSPVWNLSSTNTQDYVAVINFEEGLSGRELLNDEAKIEITNADNSEWSSVDEYVTQRVENLDPSEAVIKSNEKKTVGGKNAYRLVTDDKTFGESISYYLFYKNRVFVINLYSPSMADDHTNEYETLVKSISFTE